MDHCGFNINAGKFECRACGGDYDLKFPQPFWAVSALSKAFIKVHADCNRVMDDKIARMAGQKSAYVAVGEA